MTRERIECWQPAVAATALGMILVVAFAARAQAQAVGTAAIRGHVQDETGAAVPGVTVTVSSTALQLRERAVVTGSDGEYQHRSLPLGTYAVKFELTGFQTIVREGIQLSAGFEARIDATLKLSNVQEAVTVSGASPVIDVTTTTISSNLSRDLLDAIPTSKSLGEAIAMAPGVRYSGAIDVGGNRTGQFANGGTNFGSSQQSPFLEGINTRLFEGGSMAYLDQRSLDEIQVTAVGSSAEFATPGVAWTGVVKSGGNDFHGLISYDGQDHSLQSTNVDQALIDQGISPSGNSIDYYWDFTGQLGGRIVKDQLWFFAAYRNIRRVSNELGFSKDPGPDKKYGTPDDVPGTRTMNNPGQTLKVSYSPTPKHRVIGFMTRSIKNERERNAGLFVPRESTWDYWYDPTPWKLEYQWTPGNHVMINAMAGNSSYRALWRPQPGADVAGNPVTSDIATGFTTGPAPAAQNPNTNWQYNGSMSYFPERSLAGRHELKAGVQYYLSIYGVNYPDRVSGNYNRILDSGKAFQIQTEDRPVVADSRLDNPNVFVSDTWRLHRRLTATLGLRAEHHHLFSRGGVKEASEFGQAATYGNLDILTWNGAAPRLGAAWDIFGTGRTLLKGQWGRYLHMAAANYGSSYNPATVTVTTYNWHDLNGNLLYDPGEVNLDPNGNDFVRLQTRSSASGISSAARPVVNPDLEQPHTDETSLTIEQELASNLAFRGLLVHKRARGEYGTVNVLRPFSAWNIPITRRDPGPDGTANNADDGDLVTFFDFDPAYRGARFEQNQPVNRDADHDNVYRGFELTLTRRQAHGWSALGSFQMVKSHAWIGTKATPVSPNDLIFPLDETWDWSGKLMGSYDAPFDLRLSALYNFLAGLPQQRTYTFRSVPNASTVTIPLEALGAQRTPSQHVVNVRAARSFHVGPANRLVVSFQVFNLFNANTATDIRYVAGPTYHAISEILPPRVARFGAEFSF
jgi:carboxypeptidase family protein